jgi:hypothetical protein
MEMALGRTIKPNHNGAKNGGGAWCKRIVAKAASRKLRRRHGVAECREGASSGVRENLR